MLGQNVPFDHNLSLHSVCLSLDMLLEDVRVLHKTDMCQAEVDFGFHWPV